MERLDTENDLQVGGHTMGAGTDTHEYLVDTHCHLHDREFFTESQAQEMLGRAQQNNVREIVCIGTNLDDSVAARDFAAQHQNVYWTYGVHPEACDKVIGVDFAQHFKDTASKKIVGLTKTRSDLKSPNEVEQAKHRQMTSSKTSLACANKTIKPPIAIGEVGLDYHYDGFDRTKQIALFEQMLQLAVDNDLPVSFHVREAFDDFFPVVANFPSVRGVVHSFTDSKKTLRRILGTTDFYVGVNGLATYSTLPLPPLERILLETDAPFLTPVPFRGIINEPSYVSAVAKWLSRTMATDYKIIEKETTNNARKLFGI